MSAGCKTKMHINHLKNPVLANNLIAVSLYSRDLCFSEQNEKSLDSRVLELTQSSFSVPLSSSTAKNLKAVHV